MKIGVFFGTSTGITEDIAHRIGDYIGATVHEITEGIDLFYEYDLLILGSPTWGIGDLQDDWMYVIDDIPNMDLSDKKVALFGTGDQEAYSDSFIDAIQLLYKKILKTKAKIIGFWDSKNNDYHFTESLALKGDKFMGLAIDEINQPDLTDDRIKRWCDQILEESKK